MAQTIIISNFSSRKKCTHCKYLQSKGSGSAFKNLPFDQKYSALTVTFLQIFHYRNCEQTLLFLQLFHCILYCRVA